MFRCDGKFGFCGGVWDLNGPLLTVLIPISFTGSFSAVAAVFCVRRPFSRSADAPVGSSASRPALQ